MELTVFVGSFFAAWGIFFLLSCLFAGGPDLHHVVPITVVSALVAGLGASVGWISGALFSMWNWPWEFARVLGDGWLWISAPTGFISWWLYRLIGDLYKPAGSGFAGIWYEKWGSGSWHRKGPATERDVYEYHGGSWHRRTELDRLWIRVCSLLPLGSVVLGATLLIVFERWEALVGLALGYLGGGLSEIFVSFLAER